MRISDALILMIGGVMAVAALVGVCWFADQVVGHLVGIGLIRLGGM